MTSHEAPQATSLWRRAVPAAVLAGAVTIASVAGAGGGGAGDLCAPKPAEHCPENPVDDPFTENPGDTEGCIPVGEPIPEPTIPEECTPTTTAATTSTTELATTTTEEEATTTSTTEPQATTSTTLPGTTTTTEVTVTTVPPAEPPVATVPPANPATPLNPTE